MDGVCGEREADTDSDELLHAAEVVGCGVDAVGIAGADVGGMAVCGEATDAGIGSDGVSAYFPPSGLTARAFDRCLLHILVTIERFGMCG